MPGEQPLTSETLCVVRFCIRQLCGMLWESNTNPQEGQYRFGGMIGLVVFDFKLRYCMNSTARNNQLSHLLLLRILPAVARPYLQETAGHLYSLPKFRASSLVLLVQSLRLIAQLAKLEPDNRIATKLSG